MSQEIPGPEIKHLRVASLIGVSLVLLVQLPGIFKIKALLFGLLMTAVATGAILLMFQLLMPGCLQKLRQNRDLLVPLGLTIFAHQLLDWSAGPLFLSRPWFTFNAWIISAPISLHFLLSIALNIAYATWVTKAVLNVTQAGETNLLGVFREIPKWFWRIFGLELVGWIPVFAALAVGAPLMRSSLVVALLVIAGAVIVWNLATAALLLAGYDSGRGFQETVRAGFRASWNHKSRWWLLLVLQMLLLGLIYFSASFTSSAGNYNRNVSFSVNTFWIGAYENDFRWYTKLADTWHLARLSFFETLFSILFGVLAIGIKLHLAEVLYPRNSESELPPVITQDSVVSPDEGPDRPT